MTDIGMDEAQDIVGGVGEGGIRWLLKKFR